MTRMVTPWAEVDLVRPTADSTAVRPWDAADEYLLGHLGDHGLPAGTVAIVGDRWGALTVALATGPGARTVVQLSDSYLSQRATRENLKRNGLAADAATLLSTRDAVPIWIDTLLVRVPKSLALLEDLLHRLVPAMRPGTAIVGTGLVREIHTSTLDVFEHVVGPTRTSLAVKKARLIFSTRDPSRGHGEKPWPQTFVLPDGIGVLSGRTVTQHAGVFCAGRLDIGTRLLLAHLPERRQGADRIVDLGCGNGVLGTAAALTNPAALLTFIDESHYAVASAEATFRENLGDHRAAAFVVSDCMAEVPAGSTDLVLCNPPFHTHRVVNDATAWRMFKDARRSLLAGGEMWVVGNRHLGYHAKLRHLFGNCSVVASNAKFVVLRAVRTGQGHAL